MAYYLPLLLVARLAKPPFNNMFITFSQSPQFATVDPESKRTPLGETIESISRANWGANTDFNAIFLGLILPPAMQHHIPKDQMIKRIFVFSDMQFDEVHVEAYSAHQNAATGWKTNHDAIAGAYAKAGCDVPKLVYWDLSNPWNGHGITTSVTGERQGVALLSGCSSK